MNFFRITYLKRSLSLTLFYKPLPLLVYRYPLRWESGIGTPTTGLGYEISGVRPGVRCEEECPGLPTWADLVRREDLEQHYRLRGRKDGHSGLE